MTDINITLDDKLYERFEAVCKGLGVDPGCFIKEHAQDAMKNKMEDLAEEFADSVPPKESSKARYPQLASWMAKTFKVELATIEKDVHATLDKVLNFPEIASEYLVEKFGKPGDDTTHWMDTIAGLIKQDE